MFLFFMIYIFLLGFLYREYKHQHIWERVFCKVGTDKHWHAWMFLAFTLINLNIVLIFNLWWWLPFALSMVLGIGKEIWDTTHGQFFDYGDLKADVIAIVLAHTIHYWYLSLTLWMNLRE